MPNKVPILDSIELHKLDTRQLLKRRDALLKCEEAFEMSDRVGYEPKPIPSETGLIEFKKTPEWAQAYADLKSILSKRENIPTKAERKLFRINKAKMNRG